MNNDAGKYEWTAFPAGHWDHYHMAGQQTRFYRQQPPHLARVPFETEPPSILKWIARFFDRLGI